MKLVAFALCQSEAFRPTQKFASDPAFDNIGRAYDAIIQGAIGRAGESTEQKNGGA